MRGSAAGGSSGPKIVCPSNTIRKASDEEVVFLNGYTILKKFVMNVTGVIKIQYDIFSGTNGCDVLICTNDPYNGQVGSKSPLVYDQITQQYSGIYVDAGNVTWKNASASGAYTTDWTTKRVSAGDILYIMGSSSSTQPKIKNVKIMYDEVTDEVTVK